MKNSFLIDCSAVPESDCQKRWKSIRDHYKRQKNEEEKDSEASAVKKKRACYWNRLRFLESVEDEKRSFSNANWKTNFKQPSEEIIEIMEETNVPEKDCEASSTSRTHSPPKNIEDNSLLRFLQEMKDEKNNFQNILKELSKLSNADDDVDMFFKTVALTVKKFPSHLITEAKMKVFEIVTNMERSTHGSQDNGSICLK